MASYVVLGALLLTCFCAIDAVPTDAESPMCKQLKPSLVAKPQKLPPPFKIETDKTKYTASETLKVTLTSTGSRKLKGFIAQARRADPRLDQDELIGYFAETDGTALICETLSGNALTDVNHANGRGQGMDEKVLTWTAPTPSQGNIYFIITLIGGPTEYWQAERSEIIYDPLAEKMPPDPNPPVDPAPVHPASVDVSTCGKDKGCYRDPPGCEEPACTVLLTWVDKNNVISFELSADTDGWVAAGFSKDSLMGKDSMVECVWNRELSKVEVTKSFLDDENEPIKAIEPHNIGISATSGHYSKSRVMCRFDHVKEMRGVSQLYDLNRPYYLVLVRGKVTKDNQKLMYSPEPFKDPWISPYQVSLSDNDDVTGRARYPLVKAHACLMIIAWMMLATTGILLARYYRPMWPNDRICAERVWFSMHRMLMAVCCACTVLAFILIFIHRGGYAYYRDLPAKAHPPIGITITILIVLITIMVVCCCKPRNDTRPCCNWIHWFLTTAALVLSSPQMFIGLSLPKVHAPWWVTWVLVAFLLFHIVIELLLEIHGCINSRKQKQRTKEYELMRKNEPHREQGYEPEPVGTRFKTIILTIYLLVMIILGLIVVISVAVS